MGILPRHFSFIPYSIANIVSFYIAFIFHEHLAVFTIRNQEANLKGQTFKKKKELLSVASPELCYWLMTGALEFPSGFLCFFFLSPEGEELVGR